MSRAQERRSRKTPQCDGTLLCGKRCRVKAPCARTECSKGRDNIALGRV